MDPMLISVALLSIAIVLLVVWNILLERRIRALLTGKHGYSLEETIKENRISIEELFRFRQSVEQSLKAIDARIKTKITGTKTLRFNPFAGSGSGGNQSFATAFLDEEGNGVVLSTLYSREKVSIFAKPVKQRTSEFELTEEEKEVLK